MRLLGVVLTSAFLCLPLLLPFQSPAADEAEDNGKQQQESLDPFEDFTNKLTEINEQFFSDKSEWHKASKREFVRKKLSIFVNKSRDVQKILGEKGIKAEEINLPAHALIINRAYGIACERSGKENTRGTEFRNTLKAETRAIEGLLAELKKLGVESAEAEKVDPALLAKDPFVVFLADLKEIRFQFLCADSEWHKEYKRETVLRALTDFTNKARLLQKTVNDKGVKTGEINLPRSAMGMYNAYQDACERVGAESSRDAKFKAAFFKSSGDLYTQLAKLKELGIAPASLSFNDKKEKPKDDKKAAESKKSKPEEKKGKDDKNMDILPVEGAPTTGSVEVSWIKPSALWFLSRTA